MSWAKKKSDSVESTLFYNLRNKYTLREYKVVIRIYPKIRLKDSVLGVLNH